jgi:hypothetical protein
MYTVDKFIYALDLGGDADSFLSDVECHNGKVYLLDGGLGKIYILDDEVDKIPLVEKLSFMEYGIPFNIEFDSSFLYSSIIVTNELYSS